MAGYDSFAGMSRNAVDARRSGRGPASIAAKRCGVPCAFITQYAPSCEWHHCGTGSKRNPVREVAFYDYDETREWLETPDAQLQLQGFKAAQSIARAGKTEYVIVGCTFTWHTSNGLRKWHRMIEHSADNCLIHCTGGDMATVYLSATSTMRKNLTGNWVKVEGGERFDGEDGRTKLKNWLAAQRRKATLAANKRLQTTQ